MSFKPVFATVAVAVVAYLAYSGLRAASPVTIAANTHGWEIEPLDVLPRGPNDRHCAPREWRGRCQLVNDARRCDRFLVDNFASEAEILDMRELAQGAMALGKPAAGGVTLVDLFHGIVTHGSKFGDLFKLIEAKRPDTTALRRQLATYDAVTRRIAEMVRARFFGDGEVSIAKPAFVSKITNASAKTPNDEYWHVHVDTEQYGVFDVTTLLYLSDYAEVEGEADLNTDLTFGGGTFDFVNDETDAGVTEVLAIPPVIGRLLVFTSGPEHPHRVSPVRWGTRWAMTTAFSCSVGGADLRAFRSLLQ
jgi:hypothetical protein